MRRAVAVALVALLGAMATLDIGRATDDPVTTASLSREAYFTILEQCEPAWDPTDRNIYTTDGSSLNDVDRATRTRFVTAWQVDAWPRWRWEADCLQAAQPEVVATLDTFGVANTPVNAPSLPPQVYSAILDHCTPAWNPADRNIYATDGSSLNDVDRVTRTTYVSVWQIDAWQRWRWEMDCLLDPPPGRVATLVTARVTDDPINAPILLAHAHSATLDHCAPAWDPADRNIYATDGFSLNDVDRATRTTFVTVWQVDAWQRWRWEADCLRALQPEVLASLGAAGATGDPINAPNLPPHVYSATLDRCTPAWDPADRNIFATDGFSLNDVDRVTRTTFVTVWQVDAWQRWRWETDCLRGMFAPTIVASTTEAGATSVRESTPEQTPDPTPDPTTDPIYPMVYNVAVARGADDALARNIAAYVVTHGNVEDFLNGAHQHVAFGEYECQVWSTACPLVPQAIVLAPEAKQDGGRPSVAHQHRGPAGGDQVSSAQQGGGHSSRVSRASTGGGGRFAGYHLPICRGNSDGTSTCHVNPEWPVLEYRNGEYYRCKSLSPEGWGVGCVRY
ncbi:MAG: hypothetical protein OXN91_04865 [Chloroflexota bacterium]|nr:hypothetical protein [Chloroflexota bacterium]